MFLRLIAITLLLPLGGLLAGCACPSCKCGVPGSPHAACVHELIEPEDAPPHILISSECELVPLPAPSETFQLLEASTCQCNAATNANVANMVELERHWAKVIIECDTKNVRENLCLDRDLLALHSNDIRNKAAASALKAYYQLAGLEAQKHYLYAGIEESHKTLERIDKIKSEGLEIPPGIERSAVLTQISELEDQAQQLEFLRIQLNGQIQTLIGCPLNEYSFFWPEMDWQPDLCPVDVEAELAEGLSTRNDLRGLSLVLCKLRKTTLPIARGVLQFADSTVGSVEPREGWLHVARCFRCNEHEVPVRCRQLAIFYKHSQQGATAEIKGAAYKIGLLQQRIIIAQQSVQDLENRLEEMTKTRDINDVTIFEISNIRGQLYEAQADLVEMAVQLKIAQVELKEAQHLLAIECGFIPRLCCEGCCDGDCCQCQAKTCRKCKSSKCSTSKCECNTSSACCE